MQQHELSERLRNLRRLPTFFGVASTVRETAGALLSLLSVTTHVRMDQAVLSECRHQLAAVVSIHISCHFRALHPTSKNHASRLPVFFIAVFIDVSK